MAEKPLPPEEQNTGLANVIKLISKVGRLTNPVTTALQVMEPKTVVDATLDANPLSFSDAKQKKGFGALPEDIKYKSAVSLQKPLITKDRNIHDIAAEIVSRGIGRSEGGVTVNTSKEMELMGVIIEYWDLIQQEKDHFSRLGTPDAVEPAETRAIEKKTKELKEKIWAFDESDKIMKRGGGSVMERNPYDYQPRAI